MIYKLLDQLDSWVKFDTVSAHCDIPCKIYDPIKAQIASLSVIRFTDLIAELESKSNLSLQDQSQLARLTHEKEVHAEQVKHEIRVIWGDYFKPPQIEKFPDIQLTVHNIMLTASACKQNIARENPEKLLTLVNGFAAAFWETKGVTTFSATCPYPPEENVVYPKLN